MFLPYIKRLESVITSEMVNANKPLILGAGVFLQHPIHETGNRYDDPKWKIEVYPPYVSGAGILLNRDAMLKVQSQIGITPLTNIDDAFIGICAQKSHVKVKNMDGFRSTGPDRSDLEGYYDICQINKLVYQHKYSPSDLEPKYIFFYHWSIHNRI